jgi:hypothetical protein
MGDHRIDQVAFAARFRKAVEASVGFARSMVRQNLSDSWAFFIQPNQSFDENPLVDDQRLFPEDSLPAGRMLGPFTFERAVAWLWRDGKVPEWVDVSVHGVTEEQTCLRLICCGRFTGLEERLYYRGGLPPFGIKSPVLPPNWQSVEDSGPIDLPVIRQVRGDG